jgi:hypothetical protein
MTKEKVQNNKQQIKLVFGLRPRRGEGAAPGFNLDQLAEQLGLELQALSSSAGVLIMSGIMEQERESLAGKRYDRTSGVDRWGKQKGYVIVGGCESSGWSSTFERQRW